MLRNGKNGMPGLSIVDIPPIIILVMKWRFQWYGVNGLKPYVSQVNWNIAIFWANKVFLDTKFVVVDIIVNKHRRDKGKKKVWRYIVIYLFYQMQAKITQIQKVQSWGNSANWVITCYNITEQILIIIGKLINYEIMSS